MSSVLSRRNFLAAQPLAPVPSLATIAHISSALASTSILIMARPRVSQNSMRREPLRPESLAITAMMDATEGAYYVNDSVTRLLEMIAERNGIHLSILHSAQAPPVYSASSP